MVSRADHLGPLGYRKSFTFNLSEIGILIRGVTSSDIIWMLM